MAGEREILIPMEVSPLSSLKAVAVRLQPGEDIRKQLGSLCERHGWTAVSVLSGIGSLTGATLRLAQQPDWITVDRPLEILSLSGTLSPNGGHLHVAVSDGAGTVMGGHLGSPSPIRTTAEMVLGVLEGVEFFRRPDPDTGDEELTFRA